MFVSWLQKEYVDKLNDEVFDPSARWPSVGGSSRNFGMELLKIAIVSTTKDYVQRPDVTEVGNGYFSLS